MDWAYKWCSITWEIGSGSIVDSTVDTLGVLFNILCERWGGKNGGLLQVGPKLSRLGGTWVQSSEWNLLSGCFFMAKLSHARAENWRKTV